jgi:GTPase Era involved in 16S rRNA processing
VLTEKSHQIIFSDTPGMILSPNYLLQETMMDTVNVKEFYYTAV